MALDSSILSEIRTFAKAAKIEALQMVHDAKASHIGGCLSAADIMACLYAHILRVRPDEPDWLERDRFILSKGHAAAILYASLALRGFFPRSWLRGYCQNGQALGGHATSAGVPGVEVSTGSLGHGLPIGLGIAMGVRTRPGNSSRVYVLLSDGECDEGSVWEAALLAGARGIDNLAAIIDYNKIQSLGRTAEVIDLEPFSAKWAACRWHVVEIDGHDPEAICRALAAAGTQQKPTAVICHTVKGKGVSFMEDKLLWHYRPPSDEELALALAEIQA